MAHKLVELDNIEITVIVDNEIDPISPSNNPEVRYKGLFQGVPMTPIPAGQDRGGAKGEFRMDSICCGAHGLSLMIVGIILPLVDKTKAILVCFQLTIHRLPQKVI